MKTKKKRKKTDGGRTDDKKSKKEEREGRRKKETETEIKAGQMFPKPSITVCVVGSSSRSFQFGAAHLKFSRKLLCLQFLFATTDPTRKENMSVLQGCLPITLGLILGKFYWQTAFV